MVGVWHVVVVVKGRKYRLVDLLNLRMNMCACRWLTQMSWISFSFIVHERVKGAGWHREQITGVSRVCSVNQTNKQTKIKKKQDKLCITNWNVHQRKYTHFNTFILFVLVKLSQCIYCNNKFVIPQVNSQLVTSVHKYLSSLHRPQRYHK